MQPGQTPTFESPPVPRPLCWYAAYTTPGREWRMREALEDVGIPETFLPALPNLQTPRKRRGQHEEEQRPPLLFSRYVFLRSDEQPELLPDRVGQLMDILYLVGASRRRPSPVFDHEIAVLRELCSQERHPELGPMPEHGRVARIVSGPLTGAEGIVTHTTRAGITLAFGMPILAGCYELTVAPELVVSVGFAGTKKPRHRGGRRGRKSLLGRPAA